MSHRPRIALVVLAYVLAHLALPALAEPNVSAGGPVTLPVSGLALTLPPPAEGCEYHLSGSWALTADNSFDGRDVIDVACGDSLQSGNWISLGYFNLGDPVAVVQGTTMTGDWMAQATIWGQEWTVHGGMYDLGDLGVVPTAVMCTPLQGGMSALFYHFFLDDAAPTTQEAMLDGLRACSVLQTAWDACTGFKCATTYPTRRPEIRNRGEVAPSRDVVLEGAGLSFTIPDDGFVWLVRRDEEGGADYIDRMTPALPDLSLEVSYVADMTAAEIFAALTVTKLDPEPMVLPAGWTCGPRLVLEDKVEPTAALDLDGGVLIIGILQPKGAIDSEPLVPLIAAIGDGARAIGSEE